MAVVEGKPFVDDGKIVTMT